eukprot:Nk52_evm7s521 gene=Nk52_evmTU7s521
MSSRRALQKAYDIAIIGGGQAGLAIGAQLSSKMFKRSSTKAPSYVILDRNPVETSGAGSWPLHYDSLKLFSPAQYSQLPGLAFGQKGKVIGAPSEPRSQNYYPTRDEIVDYLQSYRDKFDLNIMPGFTVQSISSHSPTSHIPYKFKIQSEIVTPGASVSSSKTSQRVVYANAIVIATGIYDRPYYPEMGLQMKSLAEANDTKENSATIATRIIHSRDYKAPDEFMGKNVVVVGSGNSAVQIAFDIAEGNHRSGQTQGMVELSSRRPVEFAPGQLFGHLGVGNGESSEKTKKWVIQRRGRGHQDGEGGQGNDMSDSKSPSASSVREDLPLFAALNDPSKTYVLDEPIENGKYSRALSSGSDEERRKDTNVVRIMPRTLFTDFSVDPQTQRVKLHYPHSKTSSSTVDAIIFATGFESSYSFLQKDLPEALMPSNNPNTSARHISQKNGISTTIPGLFTIGMKRQRLPWSSTIPGAASDAQFLLPHILSHLNSLHEAMDSTQQCAVS